MSAKFVALCGAPQSGKSTLADFLVAEYGAIMIDDGGGLRQAAQPLFGLTHDDVYTQEGKTRSTTVCGRSYSNRQLLGNLGSLLEGFYGEQFTPEAAVAAARAHPNFDQVPFFVFPSVRKTQGLTYRNAGGLVIEVVRPGTTIVNDFDRYDHSYVTNVLLNGELAEPYSISNPFLRIGAIPEADFLAKARALFDGMVEHGILQRVTA